jgi:glycosyltransferase involved in cell wall biosynthesis/GT2 family glycosyltransferase
MENVLSLKLPLDVSSMNDFRFSVVINTDNRLDYLKRTLSGLRYQEFENFEVCVVAGPTPDGTREYLQTLGSDIKRAHCAERNLSQSRNIGIAMADGDAVVFIDDDSVPEREWLRDLAKSYADPSVGAVGGFVYDNTGVQFQARYVTVSRLGYPSDWARPTPHLDFPYTSTIPHLLGTNCSFRRSALLEIGGFDEEYEYFLDETDVCARIVDAGYRIVQRPDGFVHHKYAPSHMRDEKKIVRNWYPLLKNRVYFGLRNARGHHSVADIVGAGMSDVRGWEHSVLSAAETGDYSPAEVARFYEEADAALRDGFTRGMEPAKLLRSETREEHHTPFSAFPVTRPEGGERVICFVTQDYPPGQNGGIARNISQFARSMAAEGHHIHVFTKANGPERVDFEDGVWVHRLAIRHYPAPDVSPIAPHVVPSHIWNYSRTMLDEVAKIDARRKVDAVYCPLWDCEPLAFVLDGRFPLLLALQTTMKFWLESQPLKAADAEWMRVFGKPIIAMEEFILRSVEIMHANSRAIVSDIRAKYDVDLPDSKIVYSPHCMEDWSAQLPVAPEAASDIQRLLFVGRLESRKGIDVLLKAAPAALAEFPNAVLDIVGDDTILRPDGTTYKGEFLAQTIAPEIAERITFHGRVDEDKLRLFYRDCDIFVGPSRYESFGLVFLEALVFGKPVIACDAGGGPEVVTHGKTGILVVPGDVEGLGAALRQLLGDPALREDMGQAARADYEKRFTETVMVEDFCGALDSRLGPVAPKASATAQEAA